MEFINQMEPVFDEKEEAAVKEYIGRRAWLTEYKETRRFEDSIAAYTGARHCSVVANGTVSLMAALLACGIRPGDEVICPDYTMVASPNAIECIGARAVFADVERSTLCLDFDCMKAAVTKRTKAVMLVSLGGRYPKRLAEIVAYCREHGLWLIEDAAQSLGSFHNGRHVGTYGDIASFSFSSPKIISCGQGGALITDNTALYEKLLQVRDFGREKAGADHYMTLGFNCKFTDLQAVVGIEQMKKLPGRVARKKEMGRLYARLLAGIDGVELIETDFDETPPWFFEIICQRREALAAYLREKGVGTRPSYPPLHLEPAYGYTSQHYPVTEAVADNILWLPSTITLTDAQIAYICGCIRAFYAN